MFSINAGYGTFSDDAEPGMESYEMVDNGDTVHVTDKENGEESISNHVADKEKGELDTFISKDEKSDEDEGRDIWPRKIEYFLSVIGYIIGFGTIWRFPYMAMRNGGGAFLIPYFFFLLVLGLPLFTLEVSLGQFSGRRVISVWSVCPLFSGLGVAMLTVSGIVSVYYNMVLAWVLYYLANSFYPTLPWSTCNNEWNTPSCFTSTPQSLGANASSMAYQNITIANISATMANGSSMVSQNSTMSNISAATVYITANASNASEGLRSAAEEFWKYNVLQISTGIDDTGGICWHLALCLLAAWVITYLCVFNGIHSVGKIVYVTASAPYALLFVFLIRGVTLPGSVDGILYFLTPDFNVLLKFQGQMQDLENVWLEACLQMFYTLGPAWGGLITMSSYNKFHNNSIRDAYIICLINAFTMIFAGLVVFSILGFMAHEAGVSIEQVAESGPGLVFVAYPEAISKLPLPQMWAVLFFLMLLTVGLDSEFAMFETMTGAFTDYLPKKWKTLSVAVMAAMCFLVGLIFTTRGGIYWFQIIDWYSAAFTVLLISLLECMVLTWIYGVGQLSRDIEMMVGKKLPLAYKSNWCLFAPALMIVCFVFSLVGSSAPTYGDYVYPDWAVSFGWSTAVISMLIIPIGITWMILKSKGTLSERLSLLITPDAKWGPADKSYREMYKYRNYRNAPTLIEKIKSNVYHDYE